MNELIEQTDCIRVSKKCPKCGWRLFDKVSPTTGSISIKCPKCRAVVEINLAYRRAPGRMMNQAPRPWPIIS